VVFGPHPKGLPQPEDSVGYPHPKVQLRLVEGDNRDADQGVLEMKCPAVMTGYHNRRRCRRSPTTFTSRATCSARCRRLHYFVGRTDDMFVSGGENIYPADVERMLERHPIAQAAVPTTTTQGQAGRVLCASRTMRRTGEIKRFAPPTPAYAHPRRLVRRRTARLDQQDRPQPAAQDGSRAR
jgi:acyl-CoA synthetase (AMP-forming)/AMP-acid ligase II